MPDHITRPTPTRETQQPPIALATRPDSLPVAGPVRRSEGGRSEGGRSGGGRSDEGGRSEGGRSEGGRSEGGRSDEDGSLVSEYGLIAVLGATITGVAISWAKGGAIATLLNVILRQVRALVGA